VSRVTQALGHALARAASARPGNDPIFALNGEARARAEAGEDILNATLGALMTDDGRLATLDAANRAFAEVPADRAAGYAPIAGPPAFLDAVIEDLFEDPQLRDRAVSVATPGATGAIHHAVHNFLEPGQALLTTSHYWGPYAVIADHADRRVETFNMFTEDLTFDSEAFGAGLRRCVDEQGRALAILNFPCHNPTGYSLDSQEWNRVAEVVGDVGSRAPVAILIDHAYARFGGAGADAWIRAAAQMLESATVLVAWTASKSFAQYGARVGALVALHAEESVRTRIRSALNYSCRATFSNCNHRGLLAVTRLLGDDDLRRRAATERDELVALLNRRVALFNEHALDTGLRLPRYEGGFFVSAFVADAETTAARMREAGVYVVPSPGALRMALCATPTAEVPRLVSALADAAGSTD